MMKRKLLVLYLLLLGSVCFGQQEGYVQSGEAKIFYRIYGKGQPLLIINGGPGMNSEGFSELAGLLSGKRQVILFDQRGTGRSTLKKIDSSTITLKLMAGDIEALRKELHIDKWIILGHSFGGMLASYYATQYPKSIVSLILSSSGGIDLELLGDAGRGINKNLTQGQSDSLSYYNSRIYSGDTSYATRWQRAQVLAHAYVYHQEYAPQIAIRLMQANSTINGLVWRDMQKIHFNCAPGLASFSQPVLIIQGKQDIVSESLANKAHKAYKNSRIVLLDQCVHYGWLDRREAYLNEVENFLSQMR